MLVDQAQLEGKRSFDGRMQHPIPENQKKHHINDQWEGRRERVGEPDSKRTDSNRDPKDSRKRHSRTYAHVNEQMMEMVTIWGERWAAIFDPAHHNN